MKQKILIIDDEERWRAILTDILISENYEVIEAKDGEEGIKKAKGNELNLILLDLVLPDTNGIEVLKEIVKEKPLLPVVMISGFGEIKDAVLATKVGAYDFLEKPLDREKILLSVRNALEKEKLQREIAMLKEEIFKKYEMIGVSEPMKKIFALIEEIAQSDVTVLITGESGVGKEMVARAIHNKSKRREISFVPINCAAIPENLIESELFGYEKGAFTDAKTQKKGKLEMADKGTLFLDEVADLGSSAQAKLLRFLQEGEFERLGGNERIKVNVRIIAATNRKLKEEIEKRNFREDLYYRLNVINVHIPPLRERKEDIPVLADYFLEKYCRENGILKKFISPEALEFLKNLPWKGNVRELENLMERVAILIKSQKIMPRDLLKIMEEEEAKLKIERKGLAEATKDFQREYILKVLAENNWNKTKTAEVLKMERPNLYRKLKDLRIEISDKNISE